MNDELEQLLKNLQIIPEHDGAGNFFRRTLGRDRKGDGMEKRSLEPTLCDLQTECREVGGAGELRSLCWRAEKN